MNACCRHAICASAAVVGLLGLSADAALADNCARSRDQILAGATELPRPPKTYLALYNICQQSMRLSNVRDAFILKSGAIAVLPRNHSLSATAGTLAQFCTQFPKHTLRFISRYEAKLVRNVARVVQLGTSQTTPCQKITGGG